MKVCLVILFIIIISILYYQNKLPFLIKKKKYLCESNITENTNNIIDNVFYNKLKTVDNNIVVFNIEINNNNVGQIKILLYDNIVKNTTTNFMNLVKYKYTNMRFYKIIKNVCIYSGDYENNDGSFNESFNGGLFDDENFKVNHCEYTVVMNNNCKNSNGSQFFITLDTIPNLKNNYVAFGKIIDYESIIILKMINDVDVDKNNIPLSDCIITNGYIL